MNKFKPFFFFVIVLGMAGCEGFTPISADDASNGSQSVKVFGACDRKAVSLFNLCSEVNGADYNDIDYLQVLQTNCEATGGAFSTISCDRTGSIGACIVGKGQSNEVRTTYYPPRYSVADAEMDCDANGGEFQSH